MPELPEVETVRRDLAPALTGRRFVDVEVNWARSIRRPSAEEFKRELTGQKVKEVARRGKYLLIRLVSGDTLAVHLKMSGSLLLEPASEKEDSYLRVVLKLDNGRELRFYDMRKFGGMWLLHDESELVGKLGPEPLDPEFTADEFYRRLSKRGTPIKPLLMDQEFLAGVGNIYGDEALYAAYIHPLRKANEISREEADALLQGIRFVLEKALGNRGTTFSRFRDAYGEPGRNWDALLIPRKAPTHRDPDGVGTCLACPRCSTPITKISLRGRGTYFCAHCQR